jgi:hypothetical protein
MRKIIAGLLIASLTGFTGCALLNTNTTVQLAVQAAVDAGVGYILSKNPSEAPVIASAATALQSLATGNTTTVATLVTDADAKIASLSGLNAAEKQALESVVTLAASAITLGQGKLSASTSFDLGLVFGDIANAANIYAATSVKANAMGLK